MKFYKAKKKIEDGKILYGNLPYKYVMGYEDEEYAYFELPENIKLPGGKDNNIKLIDETIYRQNLDSIRVKEIEQRQRKNTEAVENIRNRYEENTRIKRQYESLLQVVQDRELLTEEELNTIMNS
jgi:hypothetical protein